MKELCELEARQSNNARLIGRAVELLTTVNDVIGYLASMLADDRLADKRNEIQSAIDELRTWPERDVESRRVTALNESYDRLRRMAAAKRQSFLESIDHSYFAPHLYELLRKDISARRREEVEATLKEVESRGGVA